jgi:hypothetical protein
MSMAARPSSRRRTALATASREEPWPREVAKEIALATRIVMLSAAAKTCPMYDRTDDQDAVLDAIAKVTRTKHVDGRPFAEFLDDARARLRTVAEAQVDDDDAVEETLQDIENSEPEDLVVQVYDALVPLASEAYEQTRPGTGFERPPLRRKVMETGGERPFYVKGHVPSSRSEVVLNLYPYGFDLTALALIPYMLAHELICHIGARDHGGYPVQPDPDVRDYFADGFMDRAAWYLVNNWLESESIPDVTPIGHLEEGEVGYAASRPPIFQAGRGAWKHCRKAVRARVATGDRDDTVIRGALSLNVCECDIRKKDEFVVCARHGRFEVTRRFVEVALVPREADGLLAELVIDGDRNFR